MGTTLTSIVRFLVPRRFFNGDGGKVLQSLTTVIDEHMDRARQGLEMRFPTLAARDGRDDALFLIGQDRGIPRGRTEPAAHYAQRLIRWRYPRGHRTRGSAFALLEQVSEYFGKIKCQTIDYNGTEHTWNADGSHSFSYGHTWTWDTDTARKARFWIVIYPGVLMREQPPLGDPSLWGGGFGNKDYGIGQIGATVADGDAMRNLFTGVSPWKPAGTLTQWLCVALDGAQPFTGVNPDGTWSRWSKNVAGTQVASRYHGWRYWALYPAAKTIAGDPTNFPTAATLPDGTVYAGNPAHAFATSITLPDGTVYTANPNRFLTSLTLPDDADIP